MITCLFVNLRCLFIKILFTTMSLNENKENTFFSSYISLEELDLNDYEDNELVQEVAQDL